MPRPMTPRDCDRLSEKLQRLAHDLEYDASRLAASGRLASGDAVKAISSQLGKLARYLHGGDNA